MNPLKVDIYKHKKNEEEGSTYAYTKIYSRAHKKSFLLLPGRDYLTVYSHTALPYVRHDYSFAMLFLMELRPTQEHIQKFIGSQQKLIEVNPFA